MEPLTLLSLEVFKKTVIVRIFFDQLISEEIVGNDKLQENLVYKVLQNIKSNRISDLFKKESKLLVVHLLVPQVRKLQFIDNFFLATKIGSREFMTVILNITC